MKKDLTITLIVLIVLTAITVMIFNSGMNPLVKDRVIISLSYIKILLIAFYFMELKRAHIFWKISFTGVMGVIAITVICLI